MPSFIMLYIKVKTICDKSKSPKSNLIRSNQNMTECFKFEDDFFKNHQEAFLYFKRYYNIKYNYIGSIKISKLKY